MRRGSGFAAFKQKLFNRIKTSWVVYAGRRVLRILVLLVVIGGSAVFFGLSHQRAMADLGSATLRPDGDITTGWGSDGNACVLSGGTPHWSRVDESTLDSNDYFCTGLLGAGGEEEEMSFADPTIAGTLTGVSQVVVHLYSHSSGGCQSTCDSLSVRIQIGGGYTSTQTLTMDATSQDRTLTFTGNWNSINDLQVEIVRNMLGTGPGATRDDDVRIYQMWAVADYTFSAPPAKLTQTGYIWENDDEDQAVGDTVDENTQQAAGNTAISSVKKGERLTLRTQIKNTGQGTLANRRLGLFYDQGDGLWTKVKSAVPAITSSGSCTDTSWNCAVLDNTTGGGSFNNGLAFGSSGQPWTAYYENVSSGRLKAAQYVGSGGTGCTGSTAWSCEIIQDTSSQTGVDPFIAIDPAGTPWISFEGTDGAIGNALYVAKYVGTGGTGCTGATNSGAWTCTVVDDPSGSTGFASSMAFDANGTPWIAYREGVSTGALRVAQYVGSGGTGCTGSTDWSCTTVESNSKGDLTLRFDSGGVLWLSYGVTTTNDIGVARYVGSGGSGCTSNAWTCTVIDNQSNALTIGTMALAPDGNPWIGYLDGTDDKVFVAQYVGSGGTGCAFTSIWTCRVVDDRSAISGGRGLEFDPSGSPMITYQDSSLNALIIARHVGSGGTGCTGGTDNTAWSCATVDDPTNSVGSNSTLAFAPDGKPWIIYQDSSGGDVKFATLQREGEITVSTGLSAQIGEAISESHADMTSVADTTNRDDADCIGGGTWNNGKWFESEEASSLSLAAGDSTAQCTEVAFNIDTSQAVPGRTYRFVVATNDGWRPDKGQWRGPIAISSGAYATLTVESDTTTRYSKDNTPKFPDCSDTNWSCMLVDDPSNSIGIYSATAFDSEGNPWVSYRDNTASTLKVARYVGSGGTGCGGSVTSWTCTTVDSTSGVGQYNSLGFDPAGRAWITYQDLTGNDRLKVAHYVGSGGNCSNTAWNCEYIDASDIAIRYTSIAFDPAGNPWISYQSDFVTPGSTLKVARYVGTGGSGCGFSSAWDCTTVDDPANNVGLYTSIAFDASGSAWISYQDITALALKVARYVGTGGNCTSTEWSCSEVDNTGTDTGRYTSIAFDPAGNPWVSFYDATNTSLRVATKSASFGSTCTDTSWNCGVVDNDVSTTTNTGQDSSIAFDAQGNAWVGYYEDFQTSCDDSPTTECSLKVARFVGGTGGNCTSTAWSCSTVLSLTGTGNVGKSASIAFDRSGSAWVSFYHTTNAAQAVAKLNMPVGKPTAETKIPYSGRSARTGDLRYHLDRGKSPRTESGTCSAVTDNKGYCGVAADDSDFDSVAAVADQRPLYTFATRFTTNSITPKATWIGRSNVAPSSSGTTGDLVLQVYRFGSTNGWENVTTDSSSSNCNTADCTVTGTPSGTTSEYFEADGSNYWAYFRVWQYENSSAETLKTDSISIVTNTPPNNPTSLAQKKTDDTVIATGEWINDTSVKFTASATDPDATDTLQLCVEKDTLATSFSNTEDQCGSGVAYSGSAVTVSVTITGITDANEYHWQARIKDSFGAYSSWVSYDLNAESARDFGIDMTAPTGGTVFDGTNTGVDEDFNNGSLSSLSANWSGFNANVSGLNKYQYSIGTTIGGTNVKGWTDNGTATSVTATGLTLNTSQIYYVNVRAVDNAGNTQSPVITSDGQVVAPDLNFSVSPSSISFANLNSGNNFTDTQTSTLTTSTNAYAGYVVRAFVSDSPRSTDGTKTIPDFNGGSYSLPDSWQASDRGFGYTSSDTDVQGSNKFQSDPCPGGSALVAPGCYAPFTTSRPGDIVVDHTSNVSGSPINNEQFTMTYRVTTDNTQAAGNYLAAIIYTVTALY